MRAGTTHLSRTSWLADKLATLVMASGVGYLAAAYTISRWLTRPSRWKARRTPGDLGLPWEPLECRTEDGYRLVGWAVTPPRPRATALLFHGIRNNREQTLSRSAMLAAAGFRCIAFDHRAHGDSAGRKTSFGYLEARDVAAVVALARRRWPVQPHVALGISMGAAALCYAAEHVRHCHAVVLEGCYFDIATAFENRLRQGYPPWFQRFSQGAVWVTERRLGLKLPQLCPAEHIGNLAPAPVLLLTGTEDPHATTDETQRLAARCRGPHEMWFVPRAGHRDVFEVGGEEYQNRVLNFLIGHISGQRRHAA